MSKFETQPDNLSLYLNELNQTERIDEEREQYLGQFINERRDAILELLSTSTLSDDLKQDHKTHLYISEDLVNSSTLPEDELRNLLEIIEDGNQAVDELIDSNYRLVVSIAKRYAGLGLDFEDNIQNGNMGLMSAAKKFDYTKGFRFSTYATWWIRQTVTRGISDASRTIRVPVHALELYWKIKSVKAELSKIHGEEPSYQQIADEIDNISASKVEKTIERIERTDSLSLELPTNEDEDSVLMDIIPDPDSDNIEELMSLVELQQSIEQILDFDYQEHLMFNKDPLALNEREIQYISLRNSVGFHRNEPPKTLDEIGKSEISDKNPNGITRERVRQIYNRGFNKFKVQLAKKLLVTNDYEKNLQILNSMGIFVSRRVLSHLHYLISKSRSDN